MKLHLHMHGNTEILAILAKIKTQGKLIMTTLIDIQDAIAQAAADATAEKAEVAAAIQAITDQLAALQAQLASGTLVSSSDLDGLLTSIQGVDAQVKDITVPAVPVVPPVTP